LNAYGKTLAVAFPVYVTLFVVDVIAMLAP